MCAGECVAELLAVGAEVMAWNVAEASALGERVADAFRFFVIFFGLVL